MSFRLTGNALRHAIDNRPVGHEAMVEEFLHSRTTTMIAADAGTGKSVVITQAMLQLAAGEPVFGFFHVPRPRYVYYFQLEGSPDETLDRMNAMSDVINIDTGRFYWDAESVLNCMDEMSVLETLQQINTWEHIPDVVVLDPIYMAVAGDLKNGEVASALVKFAERLKRMYGCAVIFVHHTHRQKYGNDGRRIDEDDPYYGSQWLKAHIDVGFHQKSRGGGTAGVELIAKKSRGGDVQSRIALTFDPATFTVRTDTDRSSMSGEDLVLSYLRRCVREGTHADFQGAQEATELSTASLRRIQRDLTQRGVIQVLRVNGRNRAWTFTDEATLPLRDAAPHGAVATRTH